MTSWGEEDDKRMEADYPRDDLATRMIAGYCDPTGARGMPLGVQVVARPHHDEKVLSVLSTLEEYCQAVNPIPMSQYIINGQ